jgi:hypothetical protein
MLPSRRYSSIANTWFNNPRAHQPSTAPRKARSTVDRSEYGEGQGDKFTHQ